MRYWKFNVLALSIIFN